MKLTPAKLVVFVLLPIILLGFLGWMALAYNGLVTKEQAVFAQWAQVENQFQRKVDLIPELVAQTSLYGEFERSVLENVTRLRTQWLNTSGLAARLNISSQMDTFLVQVYATYEAYPELYFGVLVQDLMFELAGTENRIAVERMRYNENVRAFNTQIRLFPDALIANMFGFQEKPYFDSALDSPLSIPSVRA